MKLNFSTQLRKQGNTLIHIKEADRKIYETIRDMIPEGAVVDMYISVQSESGNLAQLAKVHAIIRAIALHTGVQFKGIKMVVKERAGLCWISHHDGKDELECKSFGDCSHEELDMAIREAILLAEETGLVLS